MNQSFGRRVLSVVASGLLAMPMSVTAWADEPGNAALKAEIEVMKERLNRLESELSNREAVAAGAESGSSIIQLPSGVHGVKMSGFVDTSYTYNFNEPISHTNGFRAYDTRSNAFMLNNVELAVEKTASADSPVGFRTDLTFGTDAEVNGSVTTGLGLGTDELDIQQGYVEYLAPVGEGLNVKVGKFTTLHGAEVVESKDNWNFSRSFSFLYAEPLSHTGIRLAYSILEGVTATTGISNGWDIVDDNNKAKSLEFGLSATPIEGLSLASAYMVGAEQANDSRDQRHFWSFVAGYDVTDQLHLKLGYDYGHEEDMLDETGGGNGSWQGFLAYAKYDVTDQFSIATRGEIFNDQDGARTTVNAAATSPTGSSIADLDLFEWTLTGEYKFNPHLIGRLEYRYDKSNETVFRSDQGMSDYQNTVAFEVIAPF